MLKRILVTGNAGSGKTTVSQQLNKLLHIPVYGLDKIVWRSHWQRMPQSQYRAKLTKIIENEQWIIDGVCLKAVKAADVIIFLDMPRHICYWQACKRNIRYLFKSRPGLPPKCPEILILGYLIKLIWNFPRLVRPTLMQVLRQRDPEKTIIHIRNQRQLQELLPIFAAKCTNNEGKGYRFVEKSAIL